MRSEPGPDSHTPTPWSRRVAPLVPFGAASHPLHGYTDPGAARRSGSEIHGTDALITSPVLVDSRLHAEAQIGARSKSSEHSVRPRSSARRTPIPIESHDFGHSRGCRAVVPGNVVGIGRRRGSGDDRLRKLLGGCRENAPLGRPTDRNRVSSPPVESPPRHDPEGPADPVIVAHVLGKYVDVRSAPADADAVLACTARGRVPAAAAAVLHLNCGTPADEPNR